MSGLEGRARWVAASGLVLAALLGLVLARPVGGAPGDVTASQVADIRSGPLSSNPDSLFNAGGTLLFAADDGISGNELWKSNGGPLGPGGTEMVADISSGDNSAPTEFTDVNGTVFFIAGDPTNGHELRKIVPPFTTPELVENIGPGANSGVLAPAGLTNVNGTLLFAANDGTGKELWKSEAPYYDAASTEIVKNINTTTAAADSSPNPLTNVNGTLFFGADDGAGFELWKSVSPYDDGSTTKIEVNTNPGVGSDPAPLTNVNGTLLFAAADDAAETDFELWKCAPTCTSATRVKDIRPGSSGSNPDEFVNIGGTLFLVATDGIALGTHGRELWKSVAPYDTGSTSLVADIQPDSSSSNPSSLGDVGGTLFFSASDGATSGTELWKSNGGPLGPGGTEMVADINPGGGGSFPAQITDVNGTAFFSAQEPVNGQELWTSTGVGATAAADINNTGPGNGSAPNELTNVAGTLFFEALDGVTGQELWKATIEGPAPPVVTPVVTPPATIFNLTAAIKKCKKKFPKGSKKRKRCIRKAKARARA
jgi:ELWxxDGT repeat protein